MYDNIRVMRKEKTKKIVVITGASSGIGEQLKKYYEQDGNVVINLSRSAGGDENNISLDVSKEDDVKNCFKALGEKYGKIDILINCAGYGVFGAIELLESEKCRKIMDVNFFGTLWCCREALKYMKKGSRIINISSACALFSLPFRAMYSASKSAVSMMSYGLGMELKDAGIEVTAICPGDIKTNFSKNRDKTLTTNDRYKDRIELSAKQIEERESSRMDVVYASKKIYRICNKKHLKPMYIVGRMYKFFNFGNRIISNNLLYKIINRMF